MNTLSTSRDLMMAADAQPAGATLFKNVDVFDGQNEQLTHNANVLVEEDLIRQVSSRDISADGAKVIDGGGRTLMPGLTDAHYHPMFAALDQATALTALDGYINLVAAKNAEQLLMQGWTTTTVLSVGRKSRPKLSDSLLNRLSRF